MVKPEKHARNACDYSRAIIHHCLSWKTIPVASISGHSRLLVECSIALRASNVSAQESANRGCQEDSLAHADGLADLAKVFPRRPVREHKKFSVFSKSNFSFPHLQAALKLRILHHSFLRQNFWVISLRFKFDGTHSWYRVRNDRVHRASIHGVWIRTLRQGCTWLRSFVVLQRQIKVQKGSATLNESSKKVLRHFNYQLTAMALLPGAMYRTNG